MFNTVMPRILKKNQEDQRNKDAFLLLHTTLYLVLVLNIFPMSVSIATQYPLFNL